MKNFLHVLIAVTTLALTGTASVYAQDTVYTIDPALLNEAILAPVVYDPALTDTATQQTTQTDTGIMVPAATATQETTAARPTDTAATGTETPILVVTETIPGRPTQEVLTQQTEELICPTQETLECPVITPSPGGMGWNDIPFVWFVFAGAGLGGVIWGLGAYMMNASQSRRQEIRLDRATRMKHMGNRLARLEKTYPKISDDIAGMITGLPSENQKISAGQIRDYKKHAVELELNGSNETVQAHKDFLAALQKNDTKKIHPAGKKVLTAIKKDLGI